MAALDDPYGDFRQLSSSIDFRDPTRVELRIEHPVAGTFVLKGLAQSGALMDYEGFAVGSELEPLINLTVTFHRLRRDREG